MWVIEVNIAGHRFTHEVRAPHAPTLHVSPRGLRRRPTPLPQERVA
ncbi:hypothetical protein [Mycobacterium aquaticum]|nr:hypothetical protein [Mycobacterium aquaticum]